MLNDIINIILKYAYTKPKYLDELKLCYEFQKKIKNDYDIKLKTNEIIDILNNKYSKFHFNCERCNKKYTLYYNFLNLKCCCNI